MNSPRIQVILVCQGAEYRAVCKGLSQISASNPKVVPIPVGPQPVQQFLSAWRSHQVLAQVLEQPDVGILVMGLCGSLNPTYGIGDTVLYQECVDRNLVASAVGQPCDRTLTQLIEMRLQDKPASVRALTSDRLLHLAQEKRTLGLAYQADVVDMEGSVILEQLSQAGVAVSMLRVVSDDCDHDLPDLTSAISPEGALQPLPMALTMLRHPVAAARLVRGSLQALKVLQEVTTTLCRSV